jgi:hypothetical protein
VTIVDHSEAFARALLVAACPWCFA